jgi:[ribosomal protein S5]-alanine N-acetyltransferase
MLSIDSSQIKAVFRSKLMRLGRELLIALEHSSPSALNGLSEQETEQRLDSALSKVTSYQFDHERDIRAFIRLSFVIGPNFDLYPPFSDVLSSQTIPIDLKMTRLFRIAQSSDWQHAASFDIVSRSRLSRPSLGMHLTLKLVTLSPEHAQDYYALSKHPDVWRLGQLTPPRSIEHTRQYLTSLNATAQGTHFAIMAEGYGLVGSISLTRHSRLALVKYWVGHSYWRRGIATEALRTLFEHMKDDPTLQYGAASINAYNLPSLAVANKSGMSLYQHDERGKIIHFKREIRQPLFPAEGG